LICVTPFGTLYGSATGLIVVGEQMDAAYTAGQINCIETACT
jgi:hypothetical protein